MNFYEKTLVLSRLPSGELPTLHLKNSSGKLEVILQIDEPFDYIIVTNGQEIHTEEGKIALPTFTFDGVFACGVYRDNELISYGTLGKLSKEKFLQLVQKRSYSPTYTDSSDYDDWQIATENYYKGSIYDKADDDAKTGFSAEKSQKNTNGRNCIDKNDESGCPTKEQTNSNSGSKADEHTQSTSSAKRCYYDKVRCSIENILSCGKPYSELSSIIPFSRFVEISKDKKSYYIGIQGKKPDYIIYAVKGVEGLPPSGFTQSYFIPASIFKQTENGYFLTLVACTTGEAISAFSAK